MNVAGVDVGNATTEIVIVDGDGRPLAWDRMPTRGAKGSTLSGEAAARLLTRLIRRTALPVDLVAMTPQNPVRTTAQDVDPVLPATGRVIVLAQPSTTPGRPGSGVGSPVPVEAAVVEGRPVVLVARDPLGYRATADRIAAWVSAGADVRGVLLAGDEGRLVSVRIPEGIPVIDCVDTDRALDCPLVAVEVAAEGREVVRLADPIALAADLGLGDDEHASARTVTASTRGVRAVALGLLDQATADASPHLAAEAEAEQTALDRWEVELERLTTLPGLRPGMVARPSRLQALLTSGSQSLDHVEGLRSRWSGEVRCSGSEDQAGRRGALTTPGARADALVIDLGGGTIDVTDAQASRTAAGAGDLLTLAVANALGAGRGLAEWVKRGPSWRVEAPHLALRETGDREFLEPPAAPGSVGWLVAPGPSGPVPFTRTLAPAEWRALRHALKQAVLVDNLMRLLDARDTDVVLAGGPAGDDELVELVNIALPGIVAGRADVAGRLGHRWAVAYGLALEALDHDETGAR